MGSIQRMDVVLSNQDGPLNQSLFETAESMWFDSFQVHLPTRNLSSRNRKTLG